ncbi:hypothetical protein [Ralstonia soli]|uniref:Uncharacterized protein n=1 Tax=Ralstonia soli TaxID=2953896 RepID=A0ABT1AGX3_9RALS|nr:hypothetical protein [Ralstonia soli]MCO5397650.1 hypothetical protein [Ralstonia soli]
MPIQRLKTSPFFKNGAAYFYLAFTRHLIDDGPRISTEAITAPSQKDEGKPPTQIYESALAFDGLRICALPRCLPCVDLLEPSAGWAFLFDMVPTPHIVENDNRRYSGWHPAN